MKIAKNNENNDLIKHESIPTGYVPPACQPYVLRWPPDASNGREGSLREQV